MSDELELGLGTTDQVDPLRVSTSVCSLGTALLKSPTAVHEVVETHETLRRPSLPLAFGLGTTDQVVPSQLSIKVLLVVLVK